MLAKVRCFGMYVVAGIERAWRRVVEVEEDGRVRASALKGRVEAILRAQVDSGGT